MARPSRKSVVQTAPAHKTYRAATYYGNKGKRSERFAARLAADWEQQNLRGK